MAQPEPKKYSLNKAEIERIAVGALITAAGAFITYIAQVVAKTDFGTYTPLVVLVSTVVVNTIKKFLEGK